MQSNISLYMLITQSGISNVKYIYTGWTTV